MRKIRIKLIDNVTQAWKLFSVQLAFAFAVLAGMYEYIPQLQAIFSGSIVKYMALAIIVARVIKQEGVENGN